MLMGGRHGGGSGGEVGTLTFADFIVQSCTLKLGRPLSVNFCTLVKFRCRVGGVAGFPGVVTCTAIVGIVGVYIMSSET